MAYQKNHTHVITINGIQALKFVNHCVVYLKFIVHRLYLNKINNFFKGKKLISPLILSRKTFNVGKLSSSW